MLCLCAGKQQPSPTPTPKATPTPTPTPTPKATPTPTPKPTTVTSAEKVKPIDGECLKCHDNPKMSLAYPQVFSIPGHINGSAYCVYCHVPNVTKMTTQQIDAYIAKLHHETKYAKEGKCDYCHKYAKGPKVKVCGTCHDNGNLIAIHTPYHVGCKACHGNDFMRIHMEKKPFPPQFPIPTNKSVQKSGWI